MNRPRRDRQRDVPLPPPNRIPRNVAGLHYYRIESIGCASYCPAADGKGPATEVHFHLAVEGLPDPLVLRLKTKEACDQLIALLERHRNDVWPGD